MNFSSGKRIRFFTAVNGAYRNYARALERSLRLNCDMEITIFTINCELPEVPNHICVQHKMRQTMQGKYTDEQAYCMRFRALMFPTLLINLAAETRTATMLYWIDADSIVRKPIDDLLRHSEGCDITAKQKGENDFASGVMGISTNSILFAATYRKLVNKDEHWKSDQRCFAEAVKIHKGKVDFKPLPETFCDTGFNDESVIWTSKIKSHDDPKWLKEYEYYLP